MQEIRNQKLYRAFDRLINEISETIDAASLDKLAERLADCPAYQACISEIERDPVISRHFGKDIQYGTGGFRGGAAEWAEYMIAVMRAARRANDNYATVKNIYQAFEDFFHSEEINCVALAPVQGLAVLRENETLRTATGRSYDDESAPLVFADGVQIAALDRNEFAAVHQTEIVRRHHPRWSEAIYAVKVNFRVRKLIFGDDADPQIKTQRQANFERKMNTAIEKIEEVITALRLFKPGRILVGGVLVKPQNQLFGGAGTILYALGNPFFDVRLYLLDVNKDGAGLVRLHSAFIRAKSGSRKNLLVAARWFKKSGEADNLEDRVIALMIAAEALVQPSKQQKGAPIAAFIADLFPSKRVEIEKHLRGLYQLRNDIVHQGSMDKWIAENLASPNEITGYIERGADMIRNALVIAFENIKKPVKI